MQRKTEMPDGAGESRPDRRFKGWARGKDGKLLHYGSNEEAAKAEADAVTWVNEGLANNPPALSDTDLEDSRRSFEWLKSNRVDPATVVEEATLPHTGRPRVYSRNGFMVGDEYYQGDRFSGSAPVDIEAYRKDPEAYRKSGAWAVYPTVYPDPDGVSRLHTGEDAEANYRKTNKHFGVYRGLEASDFGAQWDHHRGNAEWYEKASKRQAAKAGDAGRSKSSGVPSGHNPALDGYSGPRVVINPQVFKDSRDAMCVAWDETFRILMEVNGFDPVSEPTEKQRAFFADTAYNDDERMLRRTILARICTFDTSVTDPTDEQLQEAVEFLDTVMEIGAPQNKWEQRAVQRIRDAIEKSVGQPRAEAETPEPPEDGPATAAAGGGETEEEFLARQAQAGGPASVQEDSSTQEEREQYLAEHGMDTSLAETGSMEQLKEMQDAQVDAEAPESGGPQQADQPDAGSGQQQQQQQAGQQQAGQQQAGQQQAGQGEAKKWGAVDDPHASKATGHTQTAREREWMEARKASTEAWKARNGVGMTIGGFLVTPGQSFVSQGLDPSKLMSKMESPTGGAPGAGRPAGGLQESVSRNGNKTFTINGRRVSAREAWRYRQRNGI